MQGQCKGCDRQFVDCFEQHLVSDDTRALVERLLLERLSLRDICRAVGVKLKWALGFIDTCFDALPDHFNVQLITSNVDVMIQCFEVEADEMASFVQNKVINPQKEDVRLLSDLRRLLFFLLIALV